MDENNFGIEKFDGEDAAYKGSRYSEVRDVIFANPYQKIWGGAGEPPIPVYQTTLSSVLRGILSFGKKYLFGQAAARIIDSHADLRWGPDKKGYRRIVHPNGVCLTGRWSITEDTGYSGYFAKDSEALAIARYSASKPNRGETGRSIGIAGKLYPTTDPDHAEPLRPAGFVAQEEHLRRQHPLHQRRRTAQRARRHADARRLRRFPGRGDGRDRLHHHRQDRDAAPALRDRRTRQAPREPTKCPAYMRLLMTADTPRIEGENLDIRDEVLGQMFDKGDPTPKRKLAFHIEITDDGTEFALLGFTKRTFKNWRRIGTLSFDDAVASINGDHVVHFIIPAGATTATIPRPPIAARLRETPRLRLRGAPEGPETMRVERYEHQHARRHHLRRQIRRAKAVHEKIHQQVSEAKNRGNDHRETPGRLAVRTVGGECVAAVERIGNDAADHEADQRRRHGRPFAEFDEAHQHRITRQRGRDADHYIFRKL